MQMLLYADEKWHRNKKSQTDDTNRGVVCIPTYAIAIREIPYMSTKYMVKS